MAQLIQALGERGEPRGQRERYEPLHKPLISRSRNLRERSGDLLADLRLYLARVHTQRLGLGLQQRTNRESLRVRMPNVPNEDQYGPARM